MVVTTGARAKALDEALQRGGLRPESGALPRPTVDALRPDLLEDIRQLLTELGGRAEARLRPGGWDLAYSNGLRVELDEELHFNRYRLLTLDRRWSRELPWSRDYAAYCAANEGECLSAGRWGKRWSNASCESLFGAASPPGDFTGPGAPRWKQRALYDAVKDAFALSVPSTRLARLSTHDKIDGTRLGAIPTGTDSIDPRTLAEFVRSRTT